MTPSMAQADDSDVLAQTPTAVLSCAASKPEVMRHRADFLRTASARRQAAPGFLLQGRARHDDTALIRVGFTCSKKLGNAVARNRAKRRLRELARILLPGHGRPGWDYVLVGRPAETANRNFALLLEDLVRALDRIHSQNPTKAPRP